MIDSIIRPTRRGFLAGMVPACAMACMGGAPAVALAEEEKHKYDKELGNKLTLRHYYKIQYGEMIKFAKSLEKEWGKEKTIEFIKRATAENLLEYGKNHAKQVNNDSFAAYIGTFKSPGFQDVLTFDIVEDTDTVFEMKVTECIWATTFLDADAGDIGFAHVCYGDYYWPRGFNPKISMVRDKTLMEGHAYCNHRYLWDA